VNNTNRNPKWFVYPFYLRCFGRDEVQLMFVNAALGLFGIYSQIGWLHRRLAAGVCLALAPAALA
jgi:hypothetical protein